VDVTENGKTVTWGVVAGRRTRSSLATRSR
jgi:hypothetical protein